MDTLTKPKVKKFIRIKKPIESGGATAAKEIINSSSSSVIAPLDISIILKHNKKYKPVLKQLLRKTAWFRWLHQFDIVMAEYKERAVEYFKFKEQKMAEAAAAATAAPSSPIITPLIIPKNSVVIIKKKKKT